MNNEELISLPMSLGLRVNKILESKIGFKPRTGKNGLLSFQFTEEELSLIEKLEIIDPVKGDLIGVELLPNLRSLIIESTHNSAYTQDKYVYSISDKDGISISKCKNLKILEIINQPKLTYLDVSKLKKLNCLLVSKNINLTDFYGLDSLDKLWQFSFVGNEAIVEIKDLDKIIMANKELTDLNFDLLLFPDAIGYKRDGSYNVEAFKKLDELNATWEETLSSDKNIKIGTRAMKYMHSIACKAIEDYVPKYCEPKIVVAGIELYLAENVAYDHDALKKGHSHSSIGITSGPIGGANGAYNAFVYHTCVCEGYTRAMQYLLRLRGIKSHNVDNIAGEDKLHMSTDRGDDRYKVYDLPDDGYHSIICIDDYNYLYDDPCWNACRYQGGDRSMRWTLLTKEEISKDHALSFTERNIDNNTHNVSRQTVADAFQTVVSYRAKREGQKEL